MSGKLTLRTRYITFKGLIPKDVVLPDHLIYTSIHPTGKGDKVTGEILYENYSDELRDRLLDIGLSITFDTLVDEVIDDDQLYFGNLMVKQGDGPWEKVGPNNIVKVL